MDAVIAMNAFKGCLTASEACSLVKQGFELGFPEANLVKTPLADGGDGTIDVLIAAKGGKVQNIEVVGPYGEMITAKVGILSNGDAVIESANCSGLALTSPHKRDVFSATSYGVGELMVWAVNQGARRIIIGVGGTAINDGGIGMAQAAGGKILDDKGNQVEFGILGLKNVVSVEPHDIPKKFSDVEVVALCDVKNVLIGEEGATSTYGPQKGIPADKIAQVDKYMDRYGAILSKNLGRDPRSLPGAGAGGGLAASLWAFFNAAVVSGAEFIIEETGCAKQIAKADFIITGEGKVDSQTQKGKVPHAVAVVGRAHGVPTIVLGGSVGKDVVGQHPEEFCSIFDSTLGPGTVEETIENTQFTLPFAARQVAGLMRVMLLKRPDSYQMCAGGAVIRDHGGKLQILMIRDRFGFITLPKGHVEQRENIEQAAIREVKEETGIICRLVALAGRTVYHFLDERNVPVEKTVYYYVMKQIDGETKLQPGETTEVMWVDEQDAEKGKVYANIKPIIKKSFHLYRKNL